MSLQSMGSQRSGTRQKQLLRTHLINGYELKGQGEGEGT